MPTASKYTLLNIINRTLDLTAGGTIDCHLVTAAPSSTAATGADLTVAVGGSYAPLSATLGTPALDGDGAVAVITVSTLTWSGLYTTAATPILGWAATKRAGASYATTDKFIGYYAFDSAYTPLTASPGETRIVTVTGGIIHKSEPEA